MTSSNYNKTRRLITALVAMTALAVPTVVAVQPASASVAYGRLCSDSKSSRTLYVKTSRNAPWLALAPGECAPNRQYDWTCLPYGSYARYVPSYSWGQGENRCGWHYEGGTWRVDGHRGYKWVW